MIHETTRYTVPSGTVEACRAAIRELTERIRAEQSGISSYVVFEDDGDERTRYLHVAVFEDHEAQHRHHESEALRDFTDLVYPATLDGLTRENQRVVDRVRREPVPR